MLGNAPANSGFDHWFFILELVAFSIALGLLLFARKLPVWSLWPALGFALALAVATPVYWYVAYPPLGGLDGAGRILFGVPALLGNLIVIGIAAIRVSHL